MKFNPLHNFISPVTGKLPLKMGYSFLGDQNGYSWQSPILMDMSQDIIDLRRKINRFQNLKLNYLWTGSEKGKPIERLQLDIKNLPVLGAALFPFPDIMLIPTPPPVAIPNPTFNHLSLSDWVMSGPWLPQIFAGKANATDILSLNPSNPETIVSSTLAMTQINVIQALKRLDNASFIVKSKKITWIWENFKMTVIPNVVKKLYNLDNEYTFSEAQALDELETGLILNTEGTLSTAIGGKLPDEAHYVRPIDLIEEIEAVETSVAAAIGTLEEEITTIVAQIAGLYLIEGASTALSIITTVEKWFEKEKPQEPIRPNPPVDPDHLTDKEKEEWDNYQLALNKYNLLLKAFNTKVTVVENQIKAEFTKGNNLRVNNNFDDVDFNDEAYNATAPSIENFTDKNQTKNEFGYSYLDRGHGTLWFDCKDKTEQTLSEGGLRIFSWNSSKPTSQKSLAPVHIGLFGYQNTPTPKYKGFIFSSDFDDQLPKHFGLYEVERSISSTTNHNDGWDNKEPIFEYDLQGFKFNKNIVLPIVKEYDIPLNPSVGTFLLVEY